MVRSYLKLYTMKIEVLDRINKVLPQFHLGERRRKRKKGKEKQEDNDLTSNRY